MKTIALIIWVLNGYGDGGAAINSKEPLWFSDIALCETAAKQIGKAAPHGYVVAVCVRTQ